MRFANGVNQCSPFSNKNHTIFSVNRCSNLRLNWSRIETRVRSSSQVRWSGARNASAASFAWQCIMVFFMDDWFNSAILFVFFFVSDCVERINKLAACIYSRSQVYFRYRNKVRIVLSNERNLFQSTEEQKKKQKNENEINKKKFLIVHRWRLSLPDSKTIWLFVYWTIVQWVRRETIATRVANTPHTKHSTATGMRQRKCASNKEKNY